jgi:hypothetical protein
MIIYVEEKKKLWRVPDSGLISCQTGRLAVGPKITLTWFLYPEIISSFIDWAQLSTLLTDYGFLTPIYETLL